MIAHTNRSNATPFTVAASDSNCAHPIAPFAIIAFTATRSACGWFSLSAKRAALSCCPDAAALDSSCVAPALDAFAAASSAAASAVASFHSVSFASAPPVARTSPSSSTASAHA